MKYQIVIFFFSCFVPDKAPPSSSWRLTQVKGQVLLWTKGQASSLADQDRVKLVVDPGVRPAYISTPSRVWKGLPIQPFQFPTSSLLQTWMFLPYPAFSFFGSFTFSLCGWSLSLRNVTMICWGWIINWNILCEKLNLNQCDDFLSEQVMLEKAPEWVCLPSTLLLPQSWHNFLIGFLWLENAEIKI